MSISQVSSYFNLLHVAALQFPEARSKLQAALSRAIVLTTRFVAAKTCSKHIPMVTGWQVKIQDTYACAYITSPTYLPSLHTAHVTSISFRQVDTCWLIISNSKFETVTT